MWPIQILICLLIVIQNTSAFSSSQNFSLAGSLSTDELKIVANGNFHLTTGLQMNLNDQKNYVCSPFSIGLVLTMLRQGARRMTGREIDLTIGDPAVLRPKLGTLKQGYWMALKSFENFTTNDGLTLNTASALLKNEASYGNLNPQFISAVQKLGGEAKDVDLTNSLQSANQINQWVNNRTSGKIEKLVNPNSLSADMALILLNVIYFKGTWKEKFNSSLTKDQTFHLNQTTKIKVPMMRREAYFPHAFVPELDANVVSLPFQSDRLSLLVMVPKEINGIDKIEIGLKKFAKLDDLLTKLRTRTEVEVQLPKFKIETTLNLKRHLKKLKVRELFHPVKANLGGILEGSNPPTENNLFVSGALQKAFIEIDEEGGEGAAGTGLFIQLVSYREPIRANRPFIFQIVDNWSKMVLFAGQYQNPVHH